MIVKFIIMSGVIAVFGAHHEGINKDNIGDLENQGIQYERLND